MVYQAVSVWCVQHLWLVDIHLQGHFCPIFWFLENLILIYIQTHLYYSKLGHGRHRQYYHNAHTNRHALFWVWAWKAHVMV